MHVKYQAEEEDTCMSRGGGGGFFWWRFTPVTALCIKYQASQEPHEEEDTCMSSLKLLESLMRRRIHACQVKNALGIKYQSFIVPSS